MRQLTGPEIGILSKAIIDSYNLDDFTLFLLYRLNKRIELLAPTHVTFPFQVFKVIDTSNREFWHDKLISAFLAERPYFKDVFQISLDLNVSASFYDSNGSNIDRNGLEAMVKATNHVSMEQFSNAIQLIERTVCSIKIESTDGKKEYGTGFLVTDLLLSNYHVFRSLIEEPDKFEKCTCLFDYRETYHGTEVEINVDAPVLFYSEVSKMENDKNINADWPLDKLDYALVTLNEKIGLKPFGINESGMPLESVNTNSKKLPIRKWIPAISNILPLQINQSMLFIAQHPEGYPMKFNVGKVINIDQNNLRIRYDTNTNKGSSGSPCFNEKLQWVALHNWGDPNYWAAPEYNQGIPVQNILKDLKQKGFDLVEKQKEWETV